MEIVDTEGWLSNKMPGRGHSATAKKASQALEGLIAGHMLSDTNYMKVPQWLWTWSWSWQSRKPGDYHKSNLEVVTPYTQARRTHFLASNVSAWQGESRYRCARTADSSGTTTTIDRYLGSKTLWRPQLLNPPQFCLPCVPQTMLVNRTILIRPRCKQLRAANTRAPIAASNNNYNNNRMNVLIQYPSKERFVRSHLLQQIDALNLV